MNGQFAGLDRAACVALLKSYPLSVGVLAGQWVSLSCYLQQLETIDQPLLHLDLMDGQFCPQFTVGPWAVAQLPHTFLKDVHLMVANQWATAQACVKAGAHCITLQAEGDIHLHHTLSWLGQQSVPVSGGQMPVIRGISLCPATPLEVIAPVLNEVEVIQLLAVNPGYGSKMSPGDLQMRLHQLINLLGEKRDEKLVVVDGSLTRFQLPALIALGIDRVVSGSALFRDDRLVENVGEWRAMFDLSGAEITMGLEE
ncbi:epimerase [Kluyvera genomosp. 1]|uniref:epimerase n=1 Tax=Kluyvera genomosp. 1 TaxID=2774053 RepID=UPI0006913FBF|nr:epimerase [Kluyvera genomosp. 1]